MADDLQIRGRIQAVLQAAEDPEKLKREALGRVHGVDGDWKVGEAPPAQDLNSRWRRALARNPSSVLAALQRWTPPAEVQLYGNNHEALFRLPDGGGEILIRWKPGRG